MSQKLSPLEQYLSGKLANELRYAGGQLGKGKLPYNLENFGVQSFFKRPRPTSGLNAIQTGKYGPTDWNPSANPLAAPPAPVLPPAERAYQSAKAETAAMTASDPLFKKYQVADLAKAYNAATDPNEKERIGLQIWATTNPKLAAKLKPGQTGYQEASSLFGTQTFGTNQPGVTQADINTLSETVGAPAMQEGANYTQAFTSPTNLGLGINAQQTAYSPQGEAPPSMLGAQAFSIPNALNIPDISEMQRKLRIQAFNRLLK